jgi:uncharacterized protein (TIGR02266 family)
MPAAASTAKTILIADDTASVRDRFADAIGRAGHHALVAATTDAALACLRAQPSMIDLLLVDLQMPGTGGVDFIREVSRIGDGRIPVVVFSGTVSRAVEVRELSELGVAGYVNEFSADTQIVPALAPLLFPDNFNRRGSPRVIMGIPVAYRYTNTIAAAVTLNLGKGGVAIRTMSPLDLASRARVRFRLPTSPRDVDAEARVAWSDRHVGMGLEFDRLDPRDQQAIDDYVAREHDER